MAYSLNHPTCQSVLPSGALCGCPAHVVRNNGHGKVDYRKVNGFWICSSHYKKITRNNTGHYTNHKKNYCENIDGRLGFKCQCNIVDDCQLSVDHKDGDHNNDDPDNLQTLCHNCHAVKTKQDVRNRGMNGNTGYRPEQDRPPAFPEELFGFS